MRVIYKNFSFAIASFILLFGVVALIASGSGIKQEYESPDKHLDDSKKKKKEKLTTADHSTYEILQKEFKTPEEVTEACLTCHVEAAKQIMGTIHWTWVCPKSKNKTIGKSTVINNFCMALPSNEPRCTSCHSGYGWKDKNFDFNAENKVDCLVCHDQTKTYKKFPTGAGYPVKDTTVFKGNGKTYLPPDYNYVAQNIGKPTRYNCGTCHYFGGGGNKVKHGDLDVALNACSVDIDVHMAKDSLNFECITCHTTENHRISGRCYATPAAKEKALHFPMKPDESTRIFCESCHGNHPHDYQKINDHADKVACQTCHIPVMAKANPTKMWWDWSKAGQKNEKGKPMKKKEMLDADHEVVVYDGKKGEFKWARNLEPEYFWYNGSISATTVSDKINPDTIVQVNKVHGDYNDPDARIFPFKVHRGKQPYDAVNNTFVVPKLFGKKGSGAYWAHFDWGKAIEVGMEYTGAPYSGKYDFVETEMYWLVSHMVSPKEQSLKCEDCHSSTDSRLKNLAGFYMPARDNSSVIDWMGIILIILAFGGVVIHGGFRLAFKSKNGSHAKGGDNE